MRSDKEIDSGFTRRLPYAINPFLFDEGRNNNTRSPLLTVLVNSSSKTLLFQIMEVKSSRLTVRKGIELKTCLPFSSIPVTPLQNKVLSSIRKTIEITIKVSSTISHPRFVCRTQFCSADTSRAVSYTHLDVYKRQVYYLHKV